MPPCRDEDAAVVGGDLEQRRDALGERRAVGLHRLRAVGRERQDSDRAARCGQHVNTLVPVLQREVDQGLARDASSAARQVPGPESPRRGDLLGPGRRPPRVAELGAGIGLLLDHPGRGQDVVVGHDSPPARSGTMDGMTRFHGDPDCRCGCRQCGFGYHCGPCSAAFREARRQLGDLAARHPELRTSRYGGGRRGGKAAASRQIIAEALERGEVVHVARPGGTFCAAPGHCDLPAWEGGA